MNISSSNFTQFVNLTNLTTMMMMSSNTTTTNRTITTAATTTTTTTSEQQQQQNLFPEFYDTYDSPKRRLKPSQIFGLVVGGDSNTNTGGIDYDDGSILSSVLTTINSTAGTSSNKTGTATIMTNGGLMFGDEDEDYLATIPTSNEPSEPIMTQLKTPLFYILFMLVVYGLIILVVFVSALYAHRKRVGFDYEDDEDDDDDDDVDDAASSIRHVRLREEHDEDEVAPYRSSRTKKFNPPVFKNETSEGLLMKEKIINKSSKHWESDEEEDDDDDYDDEDEYEPENVRISSSASSSSCEEDDNNNNNNNMDDKDDSSSSSCSEPELDQISKMMRPIPPTGQRNWSTEWEDRRRRRKKCRGHEDGNDGEWNKAPETEPLMTLSSSVFNKTESDVVYQQSLLVNENRL